MKDLPYSIIMDNTRAYEIMLLHDQHNNTYATVAREYGMSNARVAQLYNKAKLTQIRLYINRISIALGHSDQVEVRKIYSTVHDFYRDWKYTSAYFEREYKGILDDFRAGEPGMPSQFVENLIPFMSVVSNRTIARVVMMRDDEKATFVAIAEKMILTRAKAEHIYEWHYHQKAQVLLKRLRKKTHPPQSEASIEAPYYQKYSKAKKRYDAILHDHPELVRKRKK